MTAQQVVTLNHEALEDSLQMWSWGKWAWEGGGKTYPGWVLAMQEGYREEPARKYIPPIEEGYAEKLDLMIAQSGKSDRLALMLMVKLYIHNMSIYKLAKKLGISRNELTQKREITLGVLYGKLSD